MQLLPVSKPTILIATRNPGKFREFVTLFAELEARFVSLLDFPEVAIEEQGETFEEIALNKAEQACRATGLLTVADDSGLEVDALGGKPGTHSNRFLGEHATDADKNREIIRLLGNRPISQRVCRYKCAIAIAVPEGKTITVSADCEGFVAGEPRGEGGFGYDPIFFVPQCGKTMAELSPQEKNLLSHRGKAARKAIPFLRRLLACGHVVPCTAIIAEQDRQR